MKISIGITTYNRKKYLLKLQQSLCMSHSIDSCNIRIYDDCSTEYSDTDLKQLFPTAVEIVRRTKNMGADQNLRQMYVDFLASGDDILVTMDSDLICRPDWINFTKQYFQHTDGILSLYNSAFHKTIAKPVIHNQEFWEKAHIGAAGSVLHRDVIHEIVSNVPSTIGYDWAWSSFLRRQGVRILVSKASYVQHIGLQGFNCNGLSICEVGLNFSPISDINKNFLDDFKQEALLLRACYMHSMFKKAPR